MSETTTAVPHDGDQPPSDPSDLVKDPRRHARLTLATHRMASEAVATIGTLPNQVTGAAGTGILALLAKLANEADRRAAREAARTAVFVWAVKLVSVPIAGAIVAGVVYLLKSNWK